jgi:hypothetical protein
MKLLFTDAKTNEKVLLARVIKAGDKHQAISSPIVQTYQFDVDCALYMLDNNITSGQCDDGDDDSIAYMNWVLISDFCEVHELDDDTFVAEFLNGEIVTHDAHFQTREEMEISCKDYIKSGLFGVHVV